MINPGVGVDAVMVKPDGDLQVHEGSDVEASEHTPLIVVPASAPVAAKIVPAAIAAARKER